jgi:hypothetical protein
MQEWLLNETEYGLKFVLKNGEPKMFATIPSHNNYIWRLMQGWQDGEAQRSAWPQLSRAQVNGFAR